MVKLYFFASELLTRGSKTKKISSSYNSMGALFSLLSCEYEVDKWKKN